MSGLATRGLKVLAWVCVGAIYFLMCWGNIVSSAGAGLACPDWPLCHGTITPPMTWDIVLEWGHRTIAAATSVLIVATLWVSRKFRSQSQGLVRRLGFVVICLLASQIVLGGITVMLELSAFVSTVHLIFATIIFSLMIALALKIQNPNQNEPHPKLITLTQIGLIAMLVQIALGALVRHNHAGLACPLFPNCSDQGFWPSPYYEALLAFTHRWWGILLLGIFVHIGMASKKSPLHSRLGLSILGISIFQVLLGIGTVAMGLSTTMRAVHALVGYGLWALLFTLYVRVGGFKFFDGANHWKPGKQGSLQSHHIASANS